MRSGWECPTSSSNESAGPLEDLLRRAAWERAEGRERSGSAPPEARESRFCMHVEGNETTYPDTNVHAWSNWSRPGSRLGGETLGNVHVPPYHAMEPERPKTALAGFYDGSRHGSESELWSGGVGDGTAAGASNIWSGGVSRHSSLVDLVQRERSNAASPVLLDELSGGRNYGGGIRGTGSYPDLSGNHPGVGNSALHRTMSAGSGRASPAIGMDQHVSLEQAMANMTVGQQVQQQQIQAAVAAAAAAVSQTMDGTGGNGLSPAALSQIQTAIQVALQSAPGNNYGVNNHHGSIGVAPGSMGMASATSGNDYMANAYYQQVADAQLAAAQMGSMGGGGTYGSLDPATAAAMAAAAAAAVGSCRGNTNAAAAAAAAVAAAAASSKRVPGHDPNGSDATATAMAAAAAAAAALNSSSHGVFHQPVPQSHGPSRREERNQREKRRADRGSHGEEDGPRGSNLLEEFKANKTKRFELSDIRDHAVEFSMDQHGSRFIQQKLEIAQGDQADAVFEEVLPSSLKLMTDVFGNYVIQKFFEHGKDEHRRQLSEKLQGHVLSLSLQMYGCRVVQKALEVIDEEMQIRLVSELNGHVMRCVRDQNGNHVIQKCIECIAPNKIEFIVSSFQCNVVSLSMHPYGCRVIQRVLEHCTEQQKDERVMKEILQSVCNLAQDQYGNYVVQHVLEHGTDEEREVVVRQLAGQLVQMSQHKFASNVVEKCVQHGSISQRQILIDEMLGDTEENAPLQAMMKDQFANYVVQKMLDVCSVEQRQSLIERIRVHLHTLKKYTYGKHIVARVEKLVTSSSGRTGTAC